MWGIDPQTKKFFVGTKSVFNKVKIKINYTHADIEKNHGDKPRVASILHSCMDCLPRIEGIYQGDFIGWGGEKVYTLIALPTSFSTRWLPETIVFGDILTTLVTLSRMQRFGLVSLTMFPSKYMQTDENHSVKIKSVS